MQEIYIHPDAFEGKARTYRPQRARARTRPKAGGCTKRPEDWLRAAQVKMEEDSPSDPMDSEPGGLIERTSLCLPNYEKDTITHRGDEGFQDALRQYFPSSESNATERLVDLKARLKKASTHAFWAILMEEMCDITGAQCSFVAKRMLVDDQDSAVEMPPLGEPGSCLMGVAFYIDNGTDIKKLYRDYRYYAYGTPCAHMKHDKVFIVPEKISQVCPNNPNAKNLPFTSEAFIGVPLFVDGKSFAHFCLIYSKEGAPKRKLSWSYLEMFMHSLEDMIVQRVVEGRGFAKDNPLQSTQKPLIPLSAIAASQSLKPYARSLSHELRTPMQGVIGMLDIMYSTVQEAIETQDEPAAKLIFTDLKSHIEVVQESSKRAVEAADNVVHAYDMNMEMPESPLSSDDETPLEASHSPAQTDAFQRTNTKRKFSLSLQSRREPSEEIGFHPGPPLKKMFTMTEGDFEDESYKQQPTPTSAGEVSMSGSMIPGQMSPGESYFSRRNRNLPPPTISPTRRRIFIRDFMRTLVHDTLRGGHPTSEVCIQTALGETIEVQTQGPRGEVQERLIHLKVEQEVPIVIITEEQHLYFSLQKIVDNAVKFTETGTITITVRMGRNSLIEIWVVDTGCGITQESQEHLFTPHFQEDASLSRSRDGLGLSLFNAKAHVRRNLGGDVTLERSATEGSEKGSSFLIRLPVTSTTEMPFLVTPTSANAQIEPFQDMRLPPATVQDFSVSSEIALGASPTKVSPRKRISFNPNLAKDYPLKFLIAEDNAINRSVAVASLAKLGYDKKDITLAFDGVEAVKHYNNSLSRPLSERFNVILMDIWMPNMDGYEATTKIRDLANRSGDMANIIAVTADITSGCIDRAKEVGMHRFLAKPYKVFDIENMIKEQFSR